ncbi:MAG TPA: class I SAM-dependent methyltransferase [Microlunatus sp.]
MADTRFDAWVAEHYEVLWPELFDPATLEPAVEFLAELAADRRVLEFGVGTGRLAIPLAGRGLDVAGIELSTAMARRVTDHPDGSPVMVTIGDFATTRIDGRFGLVYLARNTITNLTTQAEQIAAFRNAAAHLQQGGHFVIENYIPQLRRLPPGETTTVFSSTADHLGFEVYDIADQIAVSQHIWTIDGELKQFSSRHRYVWPSELDLMAELAGLTLCQRWADWDRSPFTVESRSHISVWQKGIRAAETIGTGAAADPA